MVKKVNRELVLLIFIIALLIIVLIFSGFFYFKVFSGIITGHVVYNENVQDHTSISTPQEINEKTEVLNTDSKQEK